MKSPRGLAGSGVSNLNAGCEAARGAAGTGGAREGAGGHREGVGAGRGEGRGMGAGGGASMGMV